MSFRQTAGTDRAEDLAEDVSCTSSSYECKICCQDVGSKAALRKHSCKMAANTSDISDTIAKHDKFDQNQDHELRSSSPSDALHIDDGSDNGCVTLVLPTAPEDINDASPDETASDIRDTDDVIPCSPPFGSNTSAVDSSAMASPEDGVPIASGHKTGTPSVMPDLDENFRLSLESTFGTSRRQCPYCPYRTGHNQNFDKHIRHHMYTGKLRCHWCSWSVDRFNLLIRHMKVVHKQEIQDSMSPVGFQHEQERNQMISGQSFVLAGSRELQSDMMNIFFKSQKQNEASAADSAIGQPRWPETVSQKSPDKISPLPHESLKRDSTVLLSPNSNNSSKGGRGSSSSSGQSPGDANKRRMHQCPHCDHITCNPGMMKKHVQMHGQRGKYLCRFCDYSLDRLNLLFQHIRGVHKIYNPRDLHESYTDMSLGWLLGRAQVVGESEGDGVSSLEGNLDEGTVISDTGREPFEDQSTICVKGVKFYTRVWKGKRIYICKKCPHHMTTNISESLLHAQQHSSIKSTLFSPSTASKQSGSMVDNAAALEKHTNLEHEHSVHDSGADGANNNTLSTTASGSDFGLNTAKVTKAKRDRGKWHFCTKCPFKGQSPMLVEKHLTHHGYQGRYKCEYCDYGIDRLNLLHQHKRLHHQNPQADSLLQAFMENEKSSKLDTSVAMGTALDLSGTSSGEHVTLDNSLPGWFGSEGSDQKEEKLDKAVNQVIAATISSPLAGEVHGLVAFPSSHEPPSTVSALEASVCKKDAPGKHAAHQSKGHGIKQLTIPTSSDNDIVKRTSSPPVIQGNTSVHQDIEHACDRGLKNQSSPSSPPAISTRKVSTAERENANAMTTGQLMVCPLCPYLVSNPQTLVSHMTKMHSNVQTTSMETAVSSAFVPNPPLEKASPDSFPPTGSVFPTNEPSIASFEGTRTTWMGAAAGGQAGSPDALDLSVKRPVLSLATPHSIPGLPTNATSLSSAVQPTQLFSQLDVLFPQMITAGHLSGMGSTAFMTQQPHLPKPNPAPKIKLSKVHPRRPKAAQGETDNFPHKCKECPYKTASFKNFLSHLGLHGSQKRFRCHLCSWAANKMCHLVQHRKWHSKDKTG